MGMKNWKFLGGLNFLNLNIAMFVLFLKMPIILILVLVLMTARMGVNIANSQALTDDLRKVLLEDERILAAKYQLEGASERASSAQKAYFPVFQMDISNGWERQKDPGVSATSMTGQTANIAINQTVYDFGATATRVDIADINVKRANQVIKRVEQEILLEAMEAYIALLGSSNQIYYAQKSVENIQNQGDIETSKVERGIGYTTDVLQVKTQLMGAQVRLASAQGNYDQATSGYMAVFKTAPSLEVGTRKDLPEILDEKRFFLSLEQMLERVREENPQLALAKIDLQISEKQEEETKANSFFPALGLEASQSWKNDRDGTDGQQADSAVGLTLSYSFDAGLSAMNNVKGAKADALATKQLYADLLRRLERDAKIAWSQYQTALTNADILSTQTQIADKFLELARKERIAGNRSLVDVLAGETALINAQSDEIVARTQVVTAQLRLMAIMGRLAPNSLGNI